MGSWQRTCNERPERVGEEVEAELCRTAQNVSPASANRPGVAAARNSGRLRGSAFAQDMRGFDKANKSLEKMVTEGGWVKAEKGG